jgi:type IV fimbrial biogenesis protein FimT
MTQRGFTLIELLITLVIAAILSTVAVPAFTGFLARQQLASDVNELISVLSFARSEAIKQRRDIEVTLDLSASSYQITPAADPDEELRLGKLRNVSYEGSEDEFSVTFQSLGNADISNCGVGVGGNGRCEITISPQRELDSVIPITLTINITGSIRRKESES